MDQASAAAARSANTVASSTATTSGSAYRCPATVSQNGIASAAGAVRPRFTERAVCRVLALTVLRRRRRAAATVVVGRAHGACGGARRVPRMRHARARRGGRVRLLRRAAAAPVQREHRQRDPEQTLRSLHRYARRDRRPPVKMLKTHEMIAVAIAP